MKNSALCIKAVPYQEIIDLRDTLERLQSWQEPLVVLEKYFTNPNTPIDKKKVVKQFYACSTLFLLFKDNYDLLTEQANKHVLTMSRLEKMTIIESYVR
ncbi:hypothetical protein ACWOC1_07300 [Enterococcus quebecensis]|uniref:Uncharacterized protein n=1 Tax=Enterococcus quebecensis TaxID=903983 RepID=A0A1E5H3W6_9ENTE|nr:hypothetical protein [Enterococcus quebecensis]OEG19603.1 hypothetical protein BCR23_02620 [Enterococcus quebecensis]OJG75116.1 hypothetical protein RV12_GL001721 [Enterococcus quebecensis]